MDRRAATAESARPRMIDRKEVFKFQIVLVLLCMATSVSSAPASVIYEVERILVLTTTNATVLSASAANLTDYIGKLRKNEASLLSDFEDSELRSTDKRVLSSVIDQMELLATGVSSRTKSLLDRDVCGYSEPNSKYRRGNIVGETMEAMFGIAGPSQIETFNRAIVNLNETVSEQIKFNSMIIKGQTVLASVQNDQNLVLKNLSTVADKNFQKIWYLSKNEIKQRELLAITSHVHVWSRNIEQGCTTAELIIVNGMSGILSELAVPRKKLKDVVYGLSVGNNLLAPLFSTDEVSSYYSKKLTSVAIHKGFLTTALTIPMVDYREKNVVRKLTINEKQKAYNDIYSYVYIAEDRRRRTYTLLEQSDIDQALKVSSGYLIRRRRIEYFDHPCVAPLSSDVCESAIKVGDYVGQWIDYETLILAARFPVKAELKCSGAASSVMVESSVLTIPRHCSLLSEVFIIPEVKQKEIRKRTEFSMIKDHPQLQQLSKRNPGHFPGYEYVQTALDTVDEKMSIINETIANATAANENIKAIQSKIIIGVAAGAGAMGLVAIVFIVCVCYCLCTNRKTLHLPCIPC